MSAKFDKFLAKLVEKQSGGSGTANPVTWDDVTGKPLTFPPADHNHEISDVNGLQSALDSKGTVKSVNGTSPDSSGNVVLETGGDSGGGSLPSASENSVLYFNAEATTGGGNDETTKFLLQPLAGETSIVDTAAGNPAPVAITVNGTVEIGEEGGMQLDGGYGPDSITIPANALDSEIFDGEHDFTIDLVYTADSSATGRQCLFGKGLPPGRFDFILDPNGDLENGSGPDLGSGWPFDVKVLLTVEIYKEGDAWKYTCFRDGAVVASGNWGNDPAWRQNFQPIGSDGDSRFFKGTIWAFRITAGAPHKGQPFTPEPLPWTVPVVTGAWTALPLADLKAKLEALT